MGLNEKQKEEEACSRTEASTSDHEHRIDIPGSRDATTSDAIAVDLRSQQAQVIQDTTGQANSYVIQGKSLEQLEREENGQNLRNISSFMLLQNRLWIKQNTLYYELLQEKEQNLKLLTQKVGQWEKRVEDLTNQVFNLVGFFSVFQGVILTAVTQLSSSSVTTQIGPQQGQARPLCGKVWVPVFLSTLAAFVTIVSVFLKFKHLYQLQKDLNKEKHLQKVAARHIHVLKDKGSHFKFEDIEDRVKKTTSTYWFYKCLAVIGALIAFTVLLSLSYFVILCNKWVVPGWN